MGIALSTKLAQVEVILQDQQQGGLATVVSDARHLINGIHALLDGKEWSPDTADDIAFLLTQAGYTINEPYEYEEN